MQTKQNEIKKTAHVFKIRQDFQGTIFVVKGFFAENVKNFKKLFNSISWNCV